MEKNIKLLTKKSIYWASFNQFVNYGLQFVVGIFMARMLTPGDYGITALPMVFIAVADVFIDAGFGGALIRKPQISEKDLSTAFYYSIAVGVICYIIVFFCAPFIADFFKTNILVHLIRVQSLSFLLVPFMLPQNVLLKRNLDFKTISRISITTKIIGSIVGLALANLGFGVWSLVAMSVCSIALELVQKIMKVRWIPKESWNKDSFQYLWGYGNKMMASGLLDTIYRNITPIFVGKYYSPADLGIYNRAHSYAYLPSQQGTNIVQQVTFPILSQIQENTDALARNYRRMLKVSAFVIFPIMTLLSALARPLVLILVTQKWEQCIILLQILCFSSMWYPIHAINLNLLQVKGRSDLFLKLEIYKKAISLVVLCISLPFGLVYFCIANLFTSIISLMINTYYTGKLINVNYRMQMKDIFPTYVLALIIFLLVLGMNQIVENLYAQIMIGGSMGVVTYLAIAYLFHFSELQDVKYMLNRKK